MASGTLDWSQCPAVERVPERRSGAWVFRDTRMPVATVFENLEAGSDIDEIVEQFHVSREQVRAVLEFAAPATAEHGCRRRIAGRKSLSNRGWLLAWTMA